MWDEALTIAQFVGSIVVTSAVFAGGAWALYRFLFNLQAALEIRINATEIGPGSAEDRCLVEAVVEIENKGTRNTRLPWEEQVRPLSVYPVSLTKGEVEHSSAEQTHGVRQSRYPNTSATATIIRAGTTERIPFLIEVRRGHVYLLAFVAYLSRRDRRRSERAGTPTGRPTSWSGRTYIRIS